MKQLINRDHKKKNLRFLVPALLAGTPSLNEDCINSCKYPRVFGTPAIVTVSGKRKQLHTREAFGVMQLPPKATQSQVISCSNSTAPEALLPQVTLVSVLPVHQALSEIISRPLFT